MRKIFSWKDRSTWPKDWPCFDCEPNDPQLAPFTRRFRQEYIAVRGYHGSRPEDVQAYYNSGLKLSDYDDTIARAKALIKGPFFPKIPNSEIDRAIETIPYSDGGKLYISLDDRFLVEYCGHYMIYGSEFIMAIAGCLPSYPGNCGQKYLKSIGVPTVFEVDVPINAISQEDLSSLVMSISTEEHGDGVPGFEDFAFLLQEALAPDCIVDHYHPKRIPDQHDSGNEYVWADEV